ncbi:MAG TPA: hypothetical protein VGJ21_03190 [Terracidiphilus sp.]|jgi:hypothetical protein
MIVCLLAWAAQQLIAQQSTQRTADLHGRVELPHLDKPNRHVAFVVWLTPAGNAPQPAPRPPGRFTLVQKNRMFSPHLLVIPVGSTVSFPNQDPFFHNVFSLFNGRRFDLGLYEAGSTKEVVFSREGVSYIFCNIHPDMSAVVISLSTPFFAIGDNSGEFTIHDAPPGDYELHAWVEGMPQPVAESITRRVHLSADGPNNEVIDASHAASQSKDHLNKFGKPYDRDVKPY